MASPSTIGVTGGASFVGYLTLVVFPSYSHLLPIGSIIGAFVTTMLIYALAYQRGVSPVKMILSGMAVSALFGAFNDMIKTFFADALGNASGFLVGGLTDWADGWMARRYRIVTNFGKFMDPVADKLLGMLHITACVEREGQKAEIPLEERLIAGEKYVQEGGNGAIKAKYRLLQASCWFTLFTAAVIGLLSFAFAKMTLSPLSRMGGYIGAITAKDLHRRLHAQSWPAELRPLARAFDRMLARLEDNFIRLNRFSSDLAHELRTPIHQLRMALEVTLSKSRSKAEYEDSLFSQLESVARLNRLVEELLFIARAESGESAVQKTRVDIAATAEKVKDFFQDSLDEQQVEMDLSQARGLLHADGQMLLRALVNLTANALRYVPRGGHIRIGTEQENGETVITFFNDGPAIGPEHMGRLFDRFYKIDSARPSPDGYGGSGLGLSIVASIMKLHGGRAEVHNAKGGKGVVFRLVFPSKS